MDKLSHDLQIQHFSHPHLLELTNPQTLNLSPCSGCNLQSSGRMYTCRPCNFTLHESCTQLPPLISHPGHPGHSLSLFPAPAYPVGCFLCNACGQRGHGFNYHCNQCAFDIHSVCASMPIAIRHHAHPCELKLFFYPPYQSKCFICNVCRQIGLNYWLYRCDMCKFDVHWGCANANTAATYKSPPTPANVHCQPWNSFPRPAQSNLQYSNGPIQMNSQHYMQPQAQAQSLNSGTAMSGNGLVGVVGQAFVGGAAVQVGQSFVQGLMGNNSNNGGNGDNDGSSLLSDMFGTF